MSNIGCLMKAKLASGPAENHGRNVSTRCCCQGVMHDTIRCTELHQGWQAEVEAKTQSRDCQRDFLDAGQMSADCARVCMSIHAPVW